MDSKTYVIINTTDLAILDYDQLLTTSAETTIKNLEGDKTIVKYSGDMPETIEQLATKTIHTDSEIKQIVNGSDWKGLPEDEGL
jgi:hypothetical protein